jgi:hypothetical protein
MPSAQDVASVFLTPLPVGHTALHRHLLHLALHHILPHHPPLPPEPTVILHSTCNWTLNARTRIVAGAQLRAGGGRDGGGGKGSHTPGRIARHLPLSHTRQRWHCPRCRRDLHSTSPRPACGSWASHPETCETCSRGHSAKRLAASQSFGKPTGRAVETTHHEACLALGRRMGVKGRSCDVGGGRGYEGIRDAEVRGFLHGPGLIAVVPVYFVDVPGRVLL